MAPDMHRSAKGIRNFYPEGISPNIFIVDDHKWDELVRQEQSQQQLGKPKTNKLKDIDDNYELSGDSLQFQPPFIKHPKAYQTIESDDRDHASLSKISMLDDSKVSSAHEHAGSNETNEDLRDLLKFLK